MNRSHESAVTFDGMLRMLFRHKFKVFCCIVVSLAATTAAIVALPRTYTSDAKLFVRVGRESVSLDPTATTGDTIQVVTSRDVEMNTVLGVLRSRLLAEKVVDQLTPETILGRTSSAAEQPGLLGRLLPTLDAISDRERAVQYVQGGCQASVERNSDIITVSCKARTPALAQRMVASIVDAYLEEHVRLHRTSDSHMFFTTQATLLEQQLSTAFEELRAARNKAGLLSLEGQQKLLHEEMGEVQTALLRAQPALSAAEHRVTVLREALKHVPEKITLNEVAGFPNVAADTMRSQLYELEKREAELASTFVKDYPLLESTRRQVKALAGIHSEQQPQRTQFTTGANPLRQQVEKDLLAEEVSAGALRAQIKTLLEQQAQVKQRFETLNSQDFRITDLERKADLLQNHYRKYAEKLEQSRIDKALASERITNVNIMQPASLITDPASPKKPLTLAVGMVLAVLSGFAVAALAERRARSGEAAERDRRELAPAGPIVGARAPRRHAGADIERAGNLYEVAIGSGVPPYVGADRSDA